MIPILLVSWLVYTVIDTVWIFGVMQSFYKKQFGSLFNMTPSIGTAATALLVWLLLTLGIWYLVLPQVKNVEQAAWLGAFFGAVVYGVYDLTNFATLYRWPLTLLVVDWMWGMVVNALMAVIMFYLRSYFA